MKVNKLPILFGTILFLILPSAYAIGFMDVPKYWEVLPNRTYSGDFCIIDDPEGEARLELSNKSGLIADFYVDEFYEYKANIVDSTHPHIKCTTMHIKIADYKTSNEELIIEELSITLEMSKNLDFGAVSRITFDASEVSYFNVLLKFSGKLLLTIFSIFAVLTALLYMIRKTRKE